DGPSAAAAAPALQRPHAVWRAASWNELPGWSSDRTAAAWPAFERSCARPAPEWRATCAAARAAKFDAESADRDIRAWFERWTQPYRIESGDGRRDGLVTGYFEPLVAASRVRSAEFAQPLYAPPADLQTRKPYWTRRQIDLAASAQRSLRGREIAWVRDRLDVLLLQVQGSGRLAFAGERGAPPQVVRIAFAAHNDQPYVSVGRWLVERGELTLEQASWPAIRAWARQHPHRLDELLHANPRYVFFREEPLPDPTLGPKGAQGTALLPGRSIAVDPQSVPFGTPVWLDTTRPLSSRPLQRLVVAQDTGAAITGAVRADYFWGWGAEAEAEAGRMKQPLRMWALWPKSGAAATP
ncbi:MAG: MltA domain-containing protein, partial [Pseudomonadota bacterium]|nr:MltA domain-containing protein [Pseudomonadota bacterium]